MRIFICCIGLFFSFQAHSAANDQAGSRQALAALMAESSYLENLIRDIEDTLSNDKLIDTAQAQTLTLIRNQLREKDQELQNSFRSKLHEMYEKQRAARDEKYRALIEGSAAKATEITQLKLAAKMREWQKRADETNPE